MISEARQADILGERLRDVGFSDRAVGLILEQVQSLRQEFPPTGPSTVTAVSPGLDEDATAYEVDRTVEISAEEQTVTTGARPRPARVDTPTSSTPDAIDTPEGQLIEPDLPVLGAGLIVWVMVLVGSWSGLSCSPTLLGVGEVEIVGSGCGVSAPGLLSFAGLVTVLWLLAPAAWNPLRSLLRLPRLAIQPALRAMAIWLGLSLLILTTLVMASLS
ncbi:MAG: hypothetical protein R3D03_12100 [Geminicoccaceae bacterium]|nr:hypothetical protein [Geminicoccaceae bacterium]